MTPRTGAAARHAGELTTSGTPNRQALVQHPCAAPAALGRATAQSVQNAAPPRGGYLTVAASTTVL
jgi:hypothetical protein